MSTLITLMFFKIMGLGVALPLTLVLVINLFMSVRFTEYKLDLKSLAVVYFLALLGWAVYFGVV